MKHLIQFYYHKLARGWYDYLREKLGDYEEGKAPELFQNIVPFIAQTLDNPQVFKYLLNRFKLSPYDKTEGGTLFELALAYGCIEVAKLLITEFNLNPSAMHHLGITPLHTAAVHGNTKIAKWLIAEFSLDPSVKTEVNEVLGNDLSIRDYRGCTALHLAVRHGSVELAKWLITEYGVDPSVTDFKGKTLLHMAVMRGETELVKWLITEYGIDPTVRDKSGQTPLGLALLLDREELVRLLLKFE
jgi:ankyrin repeat protein